MGWERRKRGGRYYTRSRRANGRVVREYIGAGEVAKAAATLDAVDRLERLQKAEVLRQDSRRLDGAERAVDALCEVGERAARAALTAAGYRQHKRGEWRRTRTRRVTNEPPNGEQANAYAQEGNQGSRILED